MTQTRRSGIRLPWSHEDELEDGSLAAGNEESADAETGEATGSADPTDQQAIAPAAGAPEPGPVTGAGADAGEPTIPDEDNALLADLVNAMREVAERERSSSVASLKSAVDEAIERLQTRGAEGAEQLRSRADLDVAGIADWVKAEIQRIEGEGRSKTETRRQQLADQLGEHEERTQREIDALRARSTDYEKKLSSFFAELYEIADPAAFGSAAKRMPRPPTLDVPVETPVAPEAPTAVVPAAVVPAAPPPVTEATTEAPTEATTEATTEAPTEATTEVAPEPPVVTADEQVAAPVDGGPAVPSATPEPAATAEVSDETLTTAETLRDRMDALGIPAEPAPAADEPASPGAEVAASDEGGLAARLAQLDARINAATTPETVAAPVASPASTGEVATAIMVAGLGSFGAITSFKQALERVEGVNGISLSLGPTGEFVYRATHAPDFDLATAIEQIERGTAKIDRQADGSLRVTVQRSR